MKQQTSSTPGTSRFVNLRHTSKEKRDGVEAAGLPEERGLGGFSHVLTVCGATELEFLSNGLTLYVAENGGAPAAVGELPSAPLCGVALSSDSYMINCESGRVTVERQADGTYSIVAPIDFVPDVRLSAVAKRNVEVIVDGCQLADDYDLHSNSLTARDTARLHSAVGDARQRLEKAAMAAGLLIHPVMVRYRLADRSGATIYVSAPVVMGTESAGIGFPLVYDHPESSRLLAANRLGASTYGVRITTGADSRLRHVAKLTVEMSGQFDAAQFYDAVAARFVRRADGTVCLQASMDCYGDTGIVGSLVNEVMEHDGEMFRAVAAVTAPFDSDGETVLDIETGNGCDAVGQTGTAVEKCDLTAAMSVPHSVTATGAARVGDIVMLANPAPVRFRGYGAGSFALKRGAGEWRSAVAVRFSDGETAVVTEEGTGNCPVALSPVLSYPSGDAREMTVTLQSGTKVWRRTFALKPTLSGRHSLYVEPSLAPVTLDGHEAESFVIPASTATVRHIDGVAATVRTTDAATVVSARRVSDSALAAVVAAPGSSAGWDHVRARFYLFSAGGTSVATVGRDGSAAAVATVDSRRVMSREAVVATDSGVLALTADGTLIAVRGVSAKTVDRTGGSRLAYDARRRELWIIGDRESRTAAVRSADHGDYYMRTLPGPVVRTVDTPGGSLIETQGDIWRVSGPERPGEVEIEMVRRTDFAAVCPPGVRRRRSPARARSVTFDIDCPGQSRLTLELRRDHGPGEAESRPVARFDTDGRVDAPLLFNVAAPVCQGMITAVRGTVTPQATIYGITID